MSILESPAVLTSSSALARLHERILDTAGRPLEEAVTLPPECYTDPDHYAFEVEHILKREWLSVGHVSQIPNIGDYFNIDLFGEPMTVVRGKDGVIRTLSRVCRHRGMDVMPKEYGHATKGNARVFLCPYHFWSYDLDGQLKGAPEMQKSACFNRRDVCLPQFRTEIWEGFIFVTFDASLPPVTEHFRGLYENVGQWRMGELEVVLEKEWDCRFNWKVLFENFMEPYHHMGAHAKTFEPMLPARGCWTEDWQPQHTTAHLPLARDLQEAVKAGTAQPTPFPLIPTLRPQDHLEWSVHGGYPTLLLFNAPDRAYWYRIIPTGPGTMTLLTTLLVRPEAKSDPKFAEKVQAELDMLNRFHMEDMEMCEAVQKGMSSAKFAPGRLCHLEKPVWLFQRYLANRIREAQGL